MRLSIRQYASALLDIQSGLSGVDAKEAGKQFASWLSRRGETHKLAKIIAEAEALARERDGQTDVVITTAHEADHATKEVLSEYAKKLFSGRRVEASFRTDRSLIGGATIRSAETLYDASVSATVKSLRTKLSS